MRTSYLELGEGLKVGAVLWSPCASWVGILAIQFWSTTENEDNEQEQVEQARRYSGQGG